MVIIQWIEDVFYGALASGVNRSTVLLLNCALLGCIASLTFLLLISIGKHPSLPIHVGVVLLLAIALLLMINWFLSEIGLVRADDQRQEVLGDSMTRVGIDDGISTEGKKKA
eukprot:jgi/Botrbrau1/17851/Bobra.0127s0091.1